MQYLSRIIMVLGCILLAVCTDTDKVHFNVPIFDNVEGWGTRTSQFLLSNMSGILSNPYRYDRLIVLARYGPSHGK